MRKVQFADLEATLSQLLDEVQRGETIIITRDGHAVARLVPEMERLTERRQQEIDEAIESIKAFRKTMPRLSIEEILSARHEGHKY